MPKKTKNTVNTAKSAQHKVESKKEIKIRTEWNLGLIYSSPEDPQIEKDAAAIVAAYRNFAEKWSEKKAADYATTEASEKADGQAVPHFKTLTNALKDYEAMLEITGSWKPAAYFHYKEALNSEDSVARAKIASLSDRFTKAANETLFFALVLGEIPPKDQDAILEVAAKPGTTEKPNHLHHFHRFLKVLFERSRHHLSQKEERILSLLSGPLRSDWISGSNKQLRRLMITWKGKEYSAEEIKGLLETAPSTKERRTLQALLMEKIKSISTFAEAEINAVFTTKKVIDELRGHKEPFSATVLSYENEESTTRAIVDAVRERYDISHRFYALKAKLLKEKTLTYADRNAPVGKIGSGSMEFPEAAARFADAAAAFDPALKETFQDYLMSGHLDVFPRKGKSGGAFCSASEDCPVLVLLNYQNKPRDVMTLAHEMGHAFHSEFSRKQPLLYRDYSFTTAEVASTFFEEVMANEILPTLLPKDRIIFLHDQIHDAIVTIFRQIACFEFELALHKEIRSKGYVPAERIAELHNEAMSKYLGPAVKLLPDDGYFFVLWSHIREFFYVYSYAFGALVSRELFSRYMENPAYKENIMRFLKAGGSDSPEGIFTAAGIPVRDPAFFRNALGRIDRDLDELERMMKESKK